MIVDIFELTPNSRDTPTNNCYSCIGCTYLENIIVNSAHNVILNVV